MRFIYGAISTLSGHHPSWWRHHMETFSASLAFVRWIHRSPVNSPHNGQWCGALMFTLIWAWINGWVNNREAGDLRRNRAQYDVIVMLCSVLYDNRLFRQYVLWYHAVRPSTVYAIAPNLLNLGHTKYTQFIHNKIYYKHHTWKTQQAISLYFAYHDIYTLATNRWLSARLQYLHC